MSDDNFLDTTIDDWRAEMEKINIGDPGMTARELARELYPSPIPVSTMRNRLDKLISKKKCTRGIGRRIGVGGVYTVTVYQLLPKEKAGK